MALDSARVALADLGLDLEARRCDNLYNPIVLSSSADNYFDNATRRNPFVKAWTSLKLDDDPIAQALPEIARGQSHRRELQGFLYPSIAVAWQPDRFTQEDQSNDSSAATHFIDTPRRLKVPTNERNRVRRTLEQIPVVAVKPQHNQPQSITNGLQASRWASSGAATSTPARKGFMSRATVFRERPKEAAPLVLMTKNTPQDPVKTPVTGAYVFGSQKALPGKFSPEFSPPESVPKAAPKLEVFYVESLYAESALEMLQGPLVNAETGEYVIRAEI